MGTEPKNRFRFSFIKKPLYYLVYPVIISIDTTDYKEK
jgi:hypothetical protein